MSVTTVSTTTAAAARRNTNETDSVPLANARSELASLEATNSDIERRRREADVLYNIGTALDGIKLTSLYERVVVPRLNARIHRHRTLMVVGKIPTTERVLTDAQISMVEQTIAQMTADAANDDSARCFKLVMTFYLLVRDPQFRHLLIKQAPPPHPFPQSAEALAALAAAGPPPVSLTNPEALVSFLEEDLLPAYTDIVTGQRQRVNLQEWVVDRLMAYIVRLPAHATAPQHNTTTTTTTQQ
jgi:hypothetical protein